MEDISSILKDLIAKDILWSISIFYEVTERMKEQGYQISFWEGEENWATISHEDVTVGYLWKRYPLFFVLSSFANQVQAHLKNFDFIAFLGTDYMDEKKFKIDYKLLKDEFNLDINFEEFSAEDLWFSTIDS